MASAEERAGVSHCLLGLSTHLALYGDATAQNAAIDEALADADARIERELQVTLGTVRVKSWPEAGLEKGDDYDVDEEPYDYHAEQFRRFGFLRLRRKPVISIERVRIMLGPENKILTYPSQWIRINHKLGHLSIVPTPGAGWQGIVMQSGYYLLPYISFGYIQDNLPQIIAVDYTAGLGDGASYGEHFDPQYGDLRHQRGRLAAAEILLDLSNSVAPGIGSKSISEDGASQSVSYTRGGTTLFGAQIDRINTDWETFKKSWFDSNVGLVFAVV